jgi:hypothetical protein
MKRYLWLLIFTACGNTSNQVDPEFNKYIELFEKTYNLKISLNMSFAAQPYPRVGVCYTQNGKGKLIQIDRDYWNQIDDDAKELLMFHEFGHCVLGRDHRSDYMQVDGFVVPASIMNPYMFSSTVYSKNRDYYEKELAEHR